ncbi:hypothetical protein N7481_000191 [Penicillium waksmanii]|uniref:uncharacterized protein n=1 Tax=Penicillium waksmanii TaxID=69791 RepID=UPI0025470832|nr:uncharacterized protein N7481_000191 [Penicillium waksmanii]KAJ5999782.1 hypothetical protein N7481_000191 [Penicillium waksmanii]
MVASEQISRSKDSQGDAEKGDVVSQVVRDTDDHLDLPERKDSDGFQGGVQRVRAITSVWSTKTLILTFVLLYLVSFVDALLTSVQTSLNPYVTSFFNQHGLLAVVGVVSTILGGSSKLTLAKIVDIWGRVEGFLIMLFLVTIGLIVKATCKNVEAYTAGHTLYWVGHIGILYVVEIMIADMTSLKNRMIIIGLMGTPGIASTFAGPRIADSFWNELSWRWAFGSFAIMLVGVCFPIFAVMMMLRLKAEKSGVLKKDESTRKWWQSIGHYAIEFDIIGIVLITATFSLILLPFSIAAYAPKGWASGYIIAMEVLGVACVPAFYCWERFFSPVQFLPWRYLKEPTIIGSCCLYCIMFASIFIWNAYLSSYLQVVNRLSIESANYVVSAMSLTSFILSPVIGTIIRFTGDFKWTSMAGIPIFLLGTALLIPFRRPDTHVGLITLTQVLVGVGSCIFSTCGQLAVMAVVSHQEIAVVTAVWGLFGAIGAALGFAIAGGMWNNILESQINARLPEESKHLSASIFSSLVTQMSYEDGTAERAAIVGAYGDVQRKMVIVGVCLTPICVLCTYFWRNVNVKKLLKEQTAGNVW